MEAAEFLKTKDAIHVTELPANKKKKNDKESDSKIIKKSPILPVDDDN